MFARAIRSEISLLKKYLNLDPSKSSSNSSNHILTYVWFDSKLRLIRSKTVKYSRNQGEKLTIEEIPIITIKDELVLTPVRIYRDPFRVVLNDVHNSENYLVLCSDDSHNDIRTTLIDSVRKLEALFKNVRVSIEQMVTMIDAQTGRPLDWPKNGFPGPEGPYYCGVGTGRCHGRSAAEAHYQTCLFAGVRVVSLQPQSMLSQWSWEVIGGDESHGTDLMSLVDDVWMSRYIAQRVAEDFAIEINYESKPVPGKWTCSRSVIKVVIDKRVELNLTHIEQLQKVIAMAGDFSFRDFADWTIDFVEIQL